MNAGVYTITHRASGKLYVGSASNFGARWRVHQSLLRNGKHHNAHLQAAWAKYGATAFGFAEVVICGAEHLALYEQIAMDALQSTNRERGYNAAPAAGSQLGFKHSPESRQKIRSARARQVFSPETRAMWSANRTGRKMPEWFSAFASNLHRGRACSEAHKLVVSQAQKGRTHALSVIEAKSTTKLSYESAQCIKARCAEGETQTVLAKEFDVHQSTISGIVSGRSWNKPHYSKD